jgi:L-cysteine:1D-myo-inositol 2-amino-2-deoxy-alpha-D-glucopyranoside ligase
MQSWNKPNLMQIPKIPDLKNKELNLYDSKKQEVTLLPRQNDSIKIYVCGITPYDSAHLGHAFTYLTFDSIIRVLNFIGQKVLYVQNVTDLDDPLFERARKTNRPWREIVEEQVQIYRNDMSALNVIPPDHFVGVEENIELIINEIDNIKNYSYQLKDKTYFKKQEELNSLLVANKSYKELIQIASERGCDVDTLGKLNPLDPILWRGSSVDEPKWETNFGNGRPGWHIQCISLAQKYLNLPFDIQGGGKDLIYPHHSMCDEITQITKGKDFASFYCHVGMVSYEGSKMSKSKGNLVFVHQLINQGVDPLVIRLMLISKPWFKDWEFDQIELNIFQTKLEKLQKIENEFIKTNDLEIIIDFILSNLDIASAIEYLLNVEKFKEGSDLVSLRLVLNNLFGLSFKSVD